jgi:hypothetical protein
MMPKGIMPSDPSRADHRMIRYMLTTFFKKKGPEHDPKEYDKVSNVFALMGGSWERLFKGSVRDLDLLKRCLKVAVQKEVISKAPKWR